MIRHLAHARGIWFDYENSNTRVSGNVIGDLSQTVRGGIYLEASHEPNILDHNIIWRVTRGASGSALDMPPEGGWGIITYGSDEVVIAHNLFGYCEDAGVKTRTVESRIVGPRGGTSRCGQALNNIFYRCGKSIDLSHRENKADGNLYLKIDAEQMDEYRAEGRRLNWISGPEPALCLDLSAWQKYLGFDEGGAYAPMSIDVDLDALELSWTVSAPTPETKTTGYFQFDFRAQRGSQVRKARPFAALPAAPVKVSIDPRRIRSSRCRACS